MDVVYPRCAGIDVHKRTAVVTVGWVDERGRRHRETRTYGTMTADIERLGAWLVERGVTHVAMESTGVYWKPVFNLLEPHVEVVLANAAHVKAVPGRKTDVRDSEWLLDLMQHGLIRGGFIPEAPIRALRDLTRSRTGLIEERTRALNRIQKVLEDANIKLASVASEVLGVSGRAMLHALLAGQSDAALLADLAKGRLREKRAQLEAALSGRMQGHHRLILSELLCQIESLEESLARLEAAIEKECREQAPFEGAVALLDTIPGIARSTAEMIVSEIGVDMSRFPSAHHLAAWAGVAPGNHESGGKRLAGRTRQGNQALRAGLVQAAHAAAHTRGTYLAAQYHRLAARRGKKRAILAVAHSILVMAYHMIRDQEPYRELGGDYFDRSHPEATVKRLSGRLQKLGFKVTLEPLPLAA